MEGFFTNSQILEKYLKNGLIQTCVDCQFARLCRTDPWKMQYKEVYPLLISKVLTVTERSVDFYEDTHQEGNWFTTLTRSVDMKRRKLTKTYNPQDYPHYDDYPAIECSNKSNIPVDYPDKIGVPITFFYYYPELPYEIVDGPLRPKLKGKTKFPRLIIRRKQL